MQQQQSLFLIRHGDRWDYENPAWSQTSSRRGDPPLSGLGMKQARETGIYLDSVLSNESIAAENITWMSSPFLRCIQTSHTALDSFRLVKGAYHLDILPEYSVFEWDGYGGKLHDCLPPLEERKHYFPRLKVDHESLFVPELPEPRSKFQTRCERAISVISLRYPFRPGTALIVVTHAAGCIGMASAASKRPFSEIAPACPCSIFHLTRTNNIGTWTLDEHDKDGGMNGYINHMDSVGANTVPWNHFAPKSMFNGYTGPPTSRFAPEGFAATVKSDGSK